MLNNVLFLQHIKITTLQKKICVISFDHWNYDHHIVKALNNLGHDSYHIKFGDYDHKNLKDKVTNTLSKVLTGKNLKKIRRQDYVLEQLESLGKQDKILVINPEVISLKHHLKIKKHCKEYIAYLYDSVNRNPVQHLLNDVFDTIFSFDKNDIKTYNFKETSNYNYLEKTAINNAPTYDATYVGSFDSRLSELILLVNKMKAININYECLVVGKNKDLNHLKEEHSDSIKFISRKLSQTELIDRYKDSKVIIDLIRPEQIGLSFRHFEALALQKKIITNNKNVKNYSFYNSENIFVLNDGKSLEKSFFDAPYSSLDPIIYNQFTIENWVTKIFNL